MQSAHELCWIMFLGGAGVVCGTPLLGLQIYIGSFETGTIGRNDGQLFSRQMLTGTGFSLVGYR
jgi:hypothetical protein